MLSRYERVLLVAGARPNFMKIAPLVQAIGRHNGSLPNGRSGIRYRLVHTGQHYSHDMSALFFRDLALPAPDVDLGVGSGSHGEQTGKIMIAFERICRAEKPDLVMVVGDVNSTVACALTAAALSVPVAHVEAGLRSGDRTMPEEVNRVLTDHVSDFLFTTSRDADENLVSEGIDRGKIFFVGNVMIDTLRRHITAARKSPILHRLGLKSGGKVRDYAVLTLHRPSNVDDPSILRKILGAIQAISGKVPVVFPGHPRTVSRLKESGSREITAWMDSRPTGSDAVAGPSFSVIPPLGYLDFLCLMAGARLVLTDSGGIQEETTILGVPCLTLRNNTERPVTVIEGTNQVVGIRPKKIIGAALDILERRTRPKTTPELWDGKAADRIIQVLTTPRVQI